MCNSWLLTKVLKGVFICRVEYFRLAPINEGSDGTYRVAAAITQFADDSTSSLVLIMQSSPSLREIQPENRTVSMDKCHLSSAPMPELQ